MSRANTSTKTKRAPKKVKRAPAKKPKKLTDLPGEFHTVKVSETVAKQIRALMHKEMGPAHRGGEGDRMMAYCAYYDPPGICVCYGF